MADVTHIFMTGGTGFFGKSLLSKLQRGFLPGYHFTILSRDPGKFLRENPSFQGMKQIGFAVGDVRDFSFPKGHFDGVIHAGVPALALPEGVVRDIILSGTERTLDFAKTCGAEKFLFVSSCGAYGLQEPDLEKMAEDHPCHPVSEYGIAKLEAEEMCRASGFFCLLPRCFSFTGPYLNRKIHFAIGNFIRDALAGNTILLQGDGTACRSYMFADDLIDWLFAVYRKGRDREIYNIGSEEGISILSLAQTVREVLHSPAEIRFLHPPVPGGKISRYVPDTAKIRNELGVQMNYTLRQAILASLTENESDSLKTVAVPQEGK